MCGITFAIFVAVLFMYIEPASGRCITMKRTFETGERYRSKYSCNICKCNKNGIIVCTQINCPTCPNDRQLYVAEKPEAAVDERCNTCFCNEVGCTTLSC